MKQISSLMRLASSLAYGWDRRREGREGDIIRTGLIVMAGCLVLMAVTAGCDSDSNQPTPASPAMTATSEAPPALDGATLLETRCSVCHSADKPKQAKKTREEWEETTARMIAKGAKLTDAEKRAVVEYLSNR